LKSLEYPFSKASIARTDMPHRIDAQDWRQQAKQLLAAGFVPSPDNDIAPAAIASAIPQD
jgi:hypothetical protein